MEFKIQKESQEQLDLTPMVSIVFLLLIFFLVAGTVRSPAFWDIKPPDSSSNEHVTSKNLQIYLNQNGLIAFEKQTVSLASLITILDKESATIVNLQVHADKQVDSHKIITLMDALEKTIVNQITLVTTTKD